MSNWLMQNGASLIVGLLVAGVIAAVIVKMIRDKKKNKRNARHCHLGHVHRTHHRRRASVLESSVNVDGLGQRPFLHSLCATSWGFFRHYVWQARSTPR